MPLNPNGKIDKPALPFPDTVAAAAAASSSANSTSASSTQQLTSTERTIHDIWAKLLPSPPSEIPLDESFFDLGGHSILATRLIFEVRKTLAVGAPLGLVFDYPTIRALASELDSLRDSDLGLAGNKKGSTGGQGSATNADNEYSEDADKLVGTLQTSYEKPTSSDSPKTVFLTGATGFLGAFILRDLLDTSRRGSKVAKVICHVRAASQEKGFLRLRESGEGRGAWDEEWVTGGRLEVVTGDLEGDKLGMGEGVWNRLAKEVDVIVHNGAIVSPFSAVLDRAVTDVSLIHYLRCTGSTLTTSFALRTFSQLSPSSNSLLPLDPKPSLSFPRLPPSKRHTTFASQTRSCSKVV